MSLVNENITYSIIIATHNRASVLRKCLDTLRTQTYKNLEIIISHSGAQDGTLEVVSDVASSFERFQYLVSPEKGAASQRNYAFPFSKGKWIFFLDDDVECDANFFKEISRALSSFPEAGGVSGRISNQSGSPLNIVSRTLLWLSGGGFDADVNGKVRGPVINFLPYEHGQDIQLIEWMPTCVCGYKRSVLAEVGLFPAFFQDYSLAEDVYLSLKVRQRHKLILARKAVLFHNYIGGTSPQQAFSIGVMQIMNRMFILSELQHKQGVIPLMRLMVWNFANSFINLLIGHRNISIWWNSIKGYSVGFIRSLKLL